jgi:hypothetical protein
MDKFFVKQINYSVGRSAIDEINAKTKKEEM